MADEKYTLTLEGSQIDDALEQLNQRVAEGWAVGTRDGAAVPVGSIYHENNAKYYAGKAGEQKTAAEAAAARAEAAVPAGTEGAVFFTVDQSEIMTEAQKAVARNNIDAASASDSNVVKVTSQTFTTAQQSQARANIMAGGSNDNLLDNWYFVGGGSQLGDGVFPINQRGQSTYTGGGTQLDRWKTWEANDVITLTANGVKFKSPNGNGMFQYWSEFPTIKTVTFSAIIDGNIYSVTLPEGDTQYEYIGTGFKIGISRNGKCVYINSLNTEILIAACKLEDGTVSTLANDVPPNFGEELRKCHRYLWCKTFPQHTQIGIGVATDANNCVIDVVLPATMRTGATITFTANVLLIGAGGAIVSASVSAINIIDNHARLNVIAASSMVAHNTYSFITSAETTMTISAEV